MDTIEQICDQYAKNIFYKDMQDAIINASPDTVWKIFKAANETFSEQVCERQKQECAKNFQLNGHNYADVIFTPNVIKT